MPPAKSYISVGTQKIERRQRNLAAREFRIVDRILWDRVSAESIAESR
jgi:hypothetical protein